MQTRLKHAAPIQLGWSQFAFVSAGLLTILAILSVTFAYQWQELYYREFVTPRLQTRYGFRYGQIRRIRDGTHDDVKAIVSVVADGEFARMGVRAGDTPFGYHGGGFSAMHAALETGERRGFAAFDVVNVNDWNAGKEGVRTIAVYPRVREVPMPLSGYKELPWPGGPRALGTWSADGKWLAVTDRDLGSSSRCILIDAGRGTRLNLADALMTLPAFERPGSSTDRLECEIFGWVQDSPSRVAVIFRNYDPPDGERWIYDFFFDVTSGKLIDATK